jgi:hypothetical protein
MKPVLDNVSRMRDLNSPSGVQPFLCLGSWPVGDSEESRMWAMAL